MKPKENEVYILYHPSFSGEDDDTLYDLVMPTFYLTGELMGWKSTITGLHYQVAVDGYEDEFQDRIILLPKPNSNKWSKPC